jgi:hypothetical protein
MEPEMVPNPPTSQDLNNACIQVIRSGYESAQPLIDELNKSLAVTALTSIAIDRHPEAENRIQTLVIRAVAIGILAERTRWVRCVATAAASPNAALPGPETHGPKAV